MANLISQELCNLSFYAHLMVRKAAYQTADSDQHCIKSLCVRYLFNKKSRPHWWWHVCLYLAAAARLHEHNNTMLHLFFFPFSFFSSVY